MKSRLTWYGIVFFSVPAMFVACGGRSQIAFDADLYGDHDAGAGGSAAGSAVIIKGGAAGAFGKGGTGGVGGTGVAGTAGSSSIGGTGGAPSVGGSGGVSGTGGAVAGNGGKGGGAAGKSGSAGKGMDAGDIFDAFPLPDSGPVGDCVNCLKANCDASINACYNNPNCTMGIQCAVQKCFANTGGAGGATGMGGGTGTGTGGGGGGAGVNFGCLLTCFNNDFSAITAAIQSFQCIGQTCGMQCAGGLGGALGGGGNGGSTGIPTDPFGGGPQQGVMTFDMSFMMIDSVRVPGAHECPGYPELQQALSREPLGQGLANHDAVVTASKCAARRPRPGFAYLPHVRGLARR